MKRRFRKMHGLGNDFVIFDGREAPVEMTEARVALSPTAGPASAATSSSCSSRRDVADVRMRIWNADGGEVEACGNAARCVALLLGGAGWIETAGGLIAASATGASATVDMGEPRFGWDEIPLAYAMDTAAYAGRLGGSAGAVRRQCRQSAHHLLRRRCRRRSISSGSAR